MKRYNFCVTSLRC